MPLTDASTPVLHTRAWRRAMGVSCIHQSSQAASAAMRVDCWQIPDHACQNLPLEYRRCVHQSTGRAHPNRSAVARLTWHRLVPHRAFPQQYMPHQLEPRPSRNPCGVPTPCQRELSGTLTKSCSESLSDSGGTCALSVRDGVAWKPARPTPRAATVLAIDWATE